MEVLTEAADVALSKEEGVLIVVADRKALALIVDVEDA